MAADNEGIVIPVAPDDSELDSAYGDDALSDTTSITSSILAHRYEHGRRYHKFREGEYWGPNDEIQNDQLDLAHHMMRILLDDKLYLAPISKVKRVLDVGTGTGIWAIDFADENPDTEVIGVDLSPIQPEFVPPNCKFEVDDCCSPWTFPENHFDFIHVRCMFGSVSDWPKLYEEIYNHLEPGGWLNQMEMTIEFKSDDDTLGPDHLMVKWSELFIEAGEKFGKTFKIADRCKEWVKEAGFQDVAYYRYKLPVGPWSSDPKMKELGRWNYLHCLQGAEGWALFLLTHVMGWRVEEVMALVAKFKSELKNKKNHAYFEIAVVYGRKPSSAI
ncbi:S-adenosyl-L-methionine-dependent methyltransferase [Lineolata rhizophorae]|uniref:S-adenosyl-L-methionine-dependent methyltransferase n=1 Tax=Lineolata rhizophorae TaxID=578093 RepID=A0A6A6NRK5_9PEZI|nr:S-adenosyl-L-methionine-dependent methyltransferase [Lineolata rhizophorae]